VIVFLCSKLHVRNVCELWFSWARRGPLRESPAFEKSPAGIAEFSLFLPQAAFDLRGVGNDAAA